MSEMNFKREISSYGIISIKEERIEYIGGSNDTSFVLFDASGSSSKVLKNNSHMSHMPVVEEAAGLNDALILSNNDPESPYKADQSLRDVISEIQPRKKRSSNKEQLRSKSP